IALGVYALSLVGLFGVSALYHRINWRSATARDWMRRLDHSMIFVLIAGSYTPLAMLVLHGPPAVAILVGGVGRRAARGRVQPGLERCTEVAARAALCHAGMGSGGG